MSDIKSFGEFKRLEVTLIWNVVERKLVQRLFAVLLYLVYDWLDASSLVTSISREAVEEADDGGWLFAEPPHLADNLHFLSDVVGEFERESVTELPFCTAYLIAFVLFLLTDDSKVFCTCFLRSHRE